MADGPTTRLAVLIDADNAQPSLAEPLLAEVAKYGTAHVKRAYGDWTDTRLKGWKSQLLTQSIQPMQQFGYTTGKNATDSALIIDAMDLLYSGRFDGFCIVSSDSDFTRLASRIRESGLMVYGFGQKKTPEPFVAACDKFIYVEILGSKPDEETTFKPRTGAQLKQDAGLVNLMTAGQHSVVSVRSSPNNAPTSTRAVTATANSANWSPPSVCSRSNVAAPAKAARTSSTYATSRASSQLHHAHIPS